MRGAPQVGKQEAAKQRIIPADAGSTRRRSDDAFIRRDHPRGCGEHVENDLAYFEEKGSSPRMRGALRGAYL